MALTFKLRRDTEANWKNVNPVLAEGEPGVETNTNKLKVGDGSKAWNDLEYTGGQGGLEWIPVNSNHTAEPGQGLLANTSNGSFTVTLPANPEVGDAVGFADSARSWDTNNLTINGNGNKILSTDTVNVDIRDWAFGLVYNGSEWVYSNQSGVVDSVNGVTVEDNDSVVVTESESINFGSNLNVTDNGDGSVTVSSPNQGVDVEDNGSTVLSGVGGVNFGSNLNVTDNGDGSVTVSSPNQGVDVEDNGSTVLSGVGGVNFDRDLSVVDDGDGSVSVRFSENWTQISSAYTASATERILADTSSGGFTIALPASPTVSDTVWFADSARSWGTNNLTIDGNGNTIVGNNTLTINTTNSPFSLVFNGNEWVYSSQTGIIKQSTESPELSSTSFEQNEETTNTITINNYDSDLFYEITNNNTGLMNVSRSGDTITIQTLSVESDQTATFDITAKAPGIPASDPVTVTVTILFVLVLLDDTIQVTDFTFEEEYNDGWSLV